MTPTGRFKRDHAGRCSAPVVIASKPASVQSITESRYAVRPDDGADCQVWKAKP
jgi:hypothetical protein